MEHKQNMPRRTGYRANMWIPTFKADSVYVLSSSDLTAGKDTSGDYFKNQQGFYTSWARAKQAALNMYRLTNDTGRPFVMYVQKIRLNKPVDVINTRNFITIENPANAQF
jgi:hypothetical protein